MAKHTRTKLKTYFEVGKIPNQQQYGDLIDSQLNLSDENVQYLKGGIEVVGGVTSSTTLKGEDLHITDDAQIDDALTVGSVGSLTKGNVVILGQTTTLSGSGDTRLILAGNITASGEGHITASGTIFGKEYKISDRIFGSVSANSTLIGDDNYPTIIDGETITLSTLTGPVNITGDITASGNISASGTVFADNFQSTGGDDQITFVDNLFIDGNITASNNISASGNIMAIGQATVGSITSLGNNILGTNDTDLIVFTGRISTGTPDSHITASGNISASGQIIGNEGTFTTLTNINTTNITASNIRATGHVSASGELTIGDNEKLYLNKSEDTYVQSMAGDIARVVAGGNQMLILDYDTGNRAVFGNGTKVYIGSNNNALPTAELQVQGMISGSGNLKIDGSQVDFTNLPTSNPNVAGRLWNDSGTVKISAG